MEKERYALDENEKQKTASELAKKNIYWHTHPYAPIGLKAFFLHLGCIIKCCMLVWKKGIVVLHPFAPLAGAIALQVKLFTGRKLVLDSWEPHAESMVESGVWKRNSLAFRFLFHAEQRLTLQADYLIAASKSMKNYAKEKWKLAPKNVAYRPACVNLDVFDPSRFDRQKLRSEFSYENKIVAVCTGKLEGMYLGIEVIDLLKSASDFFGESFRALLLTETSEERLAEWCKKVDFPLKQLTVKKVTHSEVPAFLALADFAINPQKPIPSKRYGTPIKDGEYWAMGLPVVIPPDISEDSEIMIQENVGVIWNIQAQNQKEMWQQLNQLLKDENTKLRCMNAARNHRHFNIARRAYEEVYGNLKRCEH